MRIGTHGRNGRPADRRATPGRIGVRIGGRKGPISRRRRIRSDVSAGLLGFLTGFLLVAPPAGLDPLEGQETTERAALVDPEPRTIELGRTLYLGRASCHACHGRRGEGVDGMASSLVDREWLQIEGSPRSLLEVVRGGVPAARSRTGVPMPPRGGARLTEEEMRAVVAYVLRLREESG